MAAVEVLERVARHAEDSRASRGRSVGEPRARTSGGLRRCQVGQDRGGLRARWPPPSARRVRADNGSHRRRHPLLLRNAPGAAVFATLSAPNGSQDLLIGSKCWPW
ncbi:hypothetical protein MRX96_005341 [Rhipicephalus microplus]